MNNKILQSTLLTLFLMVLAGFFSITHAQTFVDAFDDDPTNGEQVKTFTRSYHGVEFSFTITEDGVGGDMVWIDGYGFEGSHSIDVQSASENLNIQERVIIKRTDNQPFTFTSLFVRNDDGQEIRVTGYLNGGEISEQSVQTGEESTLDFGGIGVDEIYLTSFDFLNVNIDNFEGNTNPPTTASPPTVATSSPSSITATGAILSGNVTDDGGDPVTDRGFVYSSSDNTPEIGEAGVTQSPSGNGTGTFSETISGLNASTPYYYRAYATNSEGTHYGGVESFTTESAGVLLSSSPTLTFTENSADITGDNIASDGEGGSQAISDIDIEVSNISDEDGTFLSSLDWKGHDFLFSGDPNYSGLTYDNDNEPNKGMAVKSADGSAFRLLQFTYYNWGEAEPFTNTIKGYRNDTEVASMTFEGFDPGYVPITVTLDASFSNVDDVRIYISDAGWNGDGTTNHSINNIQVSSPVLSSSPTVTTSSVSSITTTGATFSGNVTDDGGATVNERGFVYATTSGPTITDTKIQAGSGTGAFEEAITGLSAETTYYVRAYAINSQGTSYGSEQSFTTLSIFAGGSGTEADPYQVETAEHLDSVRDYADRHFIQIADIDLGVSPWSDGEGWEPIEGCNYEWQGECFESAPFNGSYDGQGYKIQNLFINREMNRMGLFSAIGREGHLKNIGVENADVTGRERTGILAGYISGVVEKSYTTGTINGVSHIGGLIGYLGGGSEISDSYSTASVTLTGNSGGGLVGTFQGVRIENSYASGAISGSNTQVGGFVGNLDQGSISNSFYDRDISGMDGGNGTPQSSLEMKTKSTFTDVGWDFDTVWQIEEPSSGSISYPYLQSTSEYPVPGYFELQIPEVITHSTIENISSGSVEVNGEVIDDKGIEITERGFVYSTSTEPNTSDNIVQSGEGTGAFSQTISGLTSGTTYYVRAYAINSSGTGYGDEISFTTLSAPVFTSTPITEVDYGQLYSYSMTATEVGDLATTISAPTLPQWLTLSTDGQSEAGQIGNLPDGAQIIGVAGDEDGNVYAATSDGTTIYKIEPDGTTAQWATGLQSGSVYALHVAGNYLYIPRHYSANKSITRIDLDNPEGGEEVFAEFSGGALSLTGNGDWIYAANFSETKIVRIHKSTKNVETVLTQSDGLLSPFGLEFNDAGNLYIATYTNSSILKYDGTSVSTALNGLPSRVTSVKTDESGNFYISMAFGGIRKYDSDWNDYTYVSPDETDNIWSISFTNIGALVYGINNTNEVYRLQTGAVLTGTPAKSDVGTHNVVLEATNTVGSIQQFFSIDVQDNVAPVVQSYSPAKSTTDVAVQPNLSVTFDEEITLGSEGSFILKNGTTDVLSYDLSIIEDRNQFSLSGDNKILNIAISDPLPNNTGLSVEIQNGSTGNIIEDIHGNAFDGFLASSDTWTFTTIANQPPVASNVSITGDLVYNHELTGSYEYADAENDDESGTTMQWYRSDDAAGTNRSAITDSTNLTYTPGKDDIGKYISFEVTPNDGNAFGSAIESDFSGPVASPFAGGDGTEAVPYEIATAEQLDYVRDFLDDGFILTADIDLGVSPWNDGEGWEPIGTDIDTFTGTLEGNGHTISNLFIDRDAGYAGLFGYVGEGGQVTSIHIENANVTSTETRVGVLAGYLDGDVSKIAVSGIVSGNGRVGGLAGAAELNSTITNVSADITIISADERAGGLLGSNRGDISNSYAYGSVTGSARVGGLIGNNHSGTVSNNYVAVELNGGGWTRGLVGDNAGGTYSGNFVDEDVANSASSGNGIFRSTGEMKTKSTFTDAGWNFDTVWQIDEPQNGSISYPNLQSNSYAPAPGLIDVQIPEVVTHTTIENITSGSAEVSGEVTDSGNLEITAAGFVWATDDAPGDTTMIYSGTLSETITGLPPGTALNVRAFAVNSAGMAFGDPVFFETLKGELLISGTFTAQDKIYDGDNTAEINQNDLTLEGVYDGHDVSLTDIELAFSDQNVDDGLEVSLNSVSLNGDDAGRYTLSFASVPTATADIAPRSITIVADAATIIYGEADPDLTYEITSGSLVTGDGLSGSLARTPGGDVSTYPIEQGDLDAGSNYDLTYVAADLEITPRELSILAIADQSKFYGEGDPVFIFEATNFGWSDDDSILSGGLSRDGGEDAGTYKITAGDLDAGSNYTIDFTVADFEITPKGLSIVADSDQSKVYGEPDPELSFTAAGFVFDDDEQILSGGPGRETGEDSGTYEIGAGNLDGGGNYVISFTPADFEITPRPLTLTNFMADSKTYDGTTDAGGSGFDDGRLGGDELTFSYDAAFVDADAATGKTIAFSNIALSGGADAANYVLQTGSGTATADISPRPITITADQKEVMYGEAGPALTYEITSGSLVTGDVLAGELSRTEGLDAGTYAIEQGSLTAGGNYEITYQAADFEITPRALAVAAEASQTKAYGEAGPAFTFAATNFGWSDDESVLTGSLDRQSGEDAGTYGITSGDLDAGANYTIDYTPADFTIKPKELLIVADSGQQKVYGETDPALTFEASGFEFADDEQILSGGLDRAPGEDTGIYPIGQGTLDAGDNYIIAFETADFEVEQRELIVKANAGQQKIYGEADPEFAFDTEGFVLGDVSSMLSGSLSRDTGEDVGSYSITAGNLDAGENYVISYEEATFQITPRELFVEADSGQQKMYGDDDPELTYTAENFAFDDDMPAFSGSILREEGESTGLYEINVGDLSAGGNYQIAFSGNDFEITGRTLTITAHQGQSNIYGSEAPEIEFSASGFVFGDDESILNGSLERENGEDVGSYEILPGSLDAGKDYILAFDGAWFEIEPALLTVRADDGQEKFIGDEDPEFTFTPEGFQFDDGPELLTGGLSREEGEEAGAYELQAGTLSAGANYVIDFEAATFQILMTAPVASSVLPADGETHIAVDEPLQVQFDQPVLENGLQLITLMGEHGQSVGIEAVIENDKLILHHKGLDNLTRYDVVVPAGALKNSDQIESEAVSWSFTTIIELPGQPVLTSPEDSTGSISLTPELHWEPVINGDTYHLQVSEGDLFDELLIDQSGISEPVFMFDSGLEMYKTYNWRVRSVNDAGVSEWPEVNTFTTIAAQPSTVFPMAEADNISTAPMLEWSSEYESSWRVQLSESAEFETIIADYLTEEVRFQLAGLEDDGRYYWRIRVESDLTTSSWTDPVAFHTRFAPQQSDVNEPMVHSIEFGTTSNREQREISNHDYRMIGLPGGDQQRLDSFFEGRYGSDWKAFYETGKDTDYYVEYDQEDGRFAFGPGRGFWVLSTEVLGLELNINSVQANERDAYSVSLHSGWNIISNPHRGPVSWSDVQELNDIHGDAWGYNQQFLMADTLHPVQAYYYYNNPSNTREYLDIPYTSMEQRRSDSRGKEWMASSRSADPSIRIIADFGDTGHHHTELLFPSADEEGDMEQVRDKLQRMYPSLEMSRSGMMLVDEGQLARGGFKRYVTNFEPEGAEHKLELKGEVGSRFNWQANFNDMPEQSAILLVNPVNSQSWLLENGESIEASFTEPHTTFDLYTGDRYWLEQMQEELMPKEFALEPNYPNPFNPVTNIRYSLPEQQHVKLEVFDVIGRRIQVITNDVQQAGWHVVQFDGSRLASGVYLYRLTTDNSVKVRKMTLVK